MNGAYACPECGGRMSIKATNHGGGVTFRIAECAAHGRWELEERVARRVQPCTAVGSRKGPPTEVDERPPPPTAANPSTRRLEGVGGGLPSGSDPVSDPDPISPAIPDQTRARSNSLTSAALCRAFGSIRCEVLKVGLPWQGVRADHAKAADMAESISTDPGALQDYQATIRLFFRKAQAGCFDRAADILREPAFAFGAWCSRFTALREELHGAQPPAPMTPEQRQRAEARARAARESAAALAATDRQIAKLRQAQAVTAPRLKTIGITTAEGEQVDVQALVHELANGKAATG